MTPLETARAALESQDVPAALEALLVVWRQTLDPRAGALIVKLGSSVPMTLTAKDWNEHSKALRPEALSALLASATSTSKVMKERVLLLGAWPADPRLDRWVAQQYAQPPFTSTGSGPFWTALKKLAGKVTDPVARQTLGALPSARLEGVKLPAIQPGRGLQADELAALAALEAAVEARGRPTSGQRTAEELLAEVLANPADLTLRSVLMDALLELQDPRGELLALQLGGKPRSAAQRKREKELIETHWAQLLGPLAPALKPGSKFANGFLVHAELRGATNSATENAIAGARGHRLWNTVESFSGEGSILAAGPFPVLRAVDTYRIPLSELTRFEQLESLAFRPNEDDLQVLVSPGQFPKLHSMELQFAQTMLPSFEAWAQARPWQRLQFTIAPNEVPRYCALLARPLSLATQQFELVVFHWNFARSRLRVSQVEGRTEVLLKPELPATVHPEWSEKLVHDATVMLEALASRPNLRPRLLLGNLSESAARAALMARVTALGGTAD